MTELEKIQYTKSFVDQMANGVNPITGEPIPETDLLRHERISRGMQYVSNILQQTIIKTEAEQQREQVRRLLSDRPSFTLPYEKRKQISLSDSPVSVSQIVRQINDQIEDPNMRRLQSKQVTEWLTVMGMLAVKNDQKGIPIKYPTDKGKQIGITSEHRSARGETYLVAVYSREAQQFIIDNLDAIIELGELV